MLTLAQMQKSSAESLRQLARVVDNRQYSICLDNMAHAMDAHQIGAFGTRDAHIVRAKLAFQRAHEDESGQVRRVREVQAVVEARDAAQDPTAAGGKSVVKLGRERGIALWQDSWTGRK